jgi:predicted nucleic acid-binding Zn ribbon protein
MGEFVRLGDALRETAERIGGSEQMRAFGAWRAAAGERVAAVTAPQRFAGGTLTVACDSAVWAQELTYLAGEILERMRQADPACPVRRLRFLPQGAAAARPR